MDSDNNYTIITQLLKIVQDIDKKVTNYTEEMSKQSERLTIIENKLEQFQNSNQKKSWLKTFFGI
jgi:uncharacterized coiled-coil protein SlyX